MFSFSTPGTAEYRTNSKRTDIIELRTSNYQELVFPQSYCGTVKLCYFVTYQEIDANMTLIRFGLILNLNLFS